MLPLFLAFVQDAEDRDLLIGYYDLHRYTMLHVAQSILHDPYLAEDAVQEAFCRLAKNIKRVRPDPKQARAFLVTIVKNVAIDIIKQRKAALALSLDELTYEFPDPVNVEDIVLQHVEATAAEQIVLSLPIIYSTVYLLRYKHDCSDGAIAALLNISESAVRKRLQRAKEKVAEAVQRERAAAFRK